MAKRKTSKRKPSTRKPPSRKAPRKRKGKSKNLFSEFPNGKRKFLEALNKSGFIVDALKECKLDRLEFDDLRRKDEKFSQRVDEVEIAVKANLSDELEKETFDRAVKGWPHKDGYRQYSPKLQEFMLGAHKPGTYNLGDASSASPEELAQRVRIALKVIKENSGIGKPLDSKPPDSKPPDSKPPKKRSSGKGTNGKATNGNRKT